MTQIAPSDAPTISGIVRSAHAGWWLFLIRGLVALAVGIVALVEPGATLAALIVLLGSFFIVDGIFAIIKAVRVLRSDASWWLLLLSGLISIAAGVAVFAWPGLTALTLDFLVGFWAIVTGIFEIMVAIALRRAIGNEWLYVVFGVVSVAFGVYVLAVPGLGLAYLTLMIAMYGIVAGVSLIVAALRLRAAGFR